MKLERGMAAVVTGRASGLGRATAQGSADAGMKVAIFDINDDAGAEHACVNSSFWMVSPRFSGLAAGASGLDTLVRDAQTNFAFRAPELYTGEWTDVGTPERLAELNR